MKEEDIEKGILIFLKFHKIYSWKNITSGYYDVKNKCYRENKSDYAINGVSDIIGILEDGKFLAIEVKKPEEMKFFTKPIEELREKLIQDEATSSQSTIKKTKRAINQNNFINEINNNGGLAFFASSVEEVISNLEKYYEIS